jgi:general stress protein YciG
MLRSKTLPLCRRACFYRPQRLLTGRSQPSPESGIPSHEPTPNTEESTVRTTESQTEVNVDKQNAGTKGRKGGRKSKKQFTLAIPGKRSKNAWL